MDDEIGNRKMKFVFKSKPLVAEGESIKVNSANRVRYCSLMGEACLHRDRLRSANALAMVPLCSESSSCIEVVSYYACNTIISEWVCMDMYDIV